MRVNRVRPGQVRRRAVVGTLPVRQERRGTGQTMGAGQDVQRFRLRVADFHKMGEVGILAADDRVELLDGEIIRMAPIGSRHAWTVDELADRFRAAAGGRARVSQQNPLVLAEHDEPQPDLMLLRSRHEGYRDALPTAADALLIVEVADTTLDRDLTLKVPLYARHGVPEVWVIDLAGRRLFVFTAPAEGGYSARRELGPPDRVSPGCLPGFELPLADILG